MWLIQQQLELQPAKQKNQTPPVHLYAPFDTLSTFLLPISAFVASEGCFDLNGPRLKAASHRCFKASAVVLSCKCFPDPPRGQKSSRCLRGCSSGAESVAADLPVGEDVIVELLKRRFECVRVLFFLFTSKTHPCLHMKSASQHGEMCFPTSESMFFYTIKPHDKR